MTAPDLAGSPPGDDDASVVLGALARAGARGAAVTIAGVRATLSLICIAAVSTGLAALALGVWAWRNALPGAVLATIGGVTTVAIAGYVFIRSRSLTEALRHPNEVVDQAQDLVMRATGSPELRRLAGSLRSKKAGTPSGLGRTRRAMRTGRLISNVIGLAAPDPKRHGLLIPFTPDRLRNLWLAIWVGLWAWLISAVIASLAFLSLAIQTL